MKNPNELITEKLDEIFSKVEYTPDTVDLYDEVFMNLKESCSDYMESGLSHELAIEKAFSDLGDLSELLNDLSPSAKTNISEGEETTGINGSELTGGASTMEGSFKEEEAKPFPKVIVGAFLSKRVLVNQVAIPSDSITNVAVSYTYDSLEFLPSHDDNFYIKEFMNLNDPRLFTRWQVENNILTIESGQRPLVSIGINGLNTKIKIFIPKSYHHKLQIKVTSGSVKIEELGHLTSLETEVTSGSQKLSEISADQLQTYGSSGSIKLKEITSTDFRGKASSGTIQVKEITTNTFKAYTTSGSIKIDDSTISEHLDLESTSGSLKVLDTNTNEMKLRATSGSIRGVVSNVKGIFKTKSGSIKLITPLLSGTTQLHSASGSISLQLKEEQVFNFKLRFGSGSGKVKLPKTLINVQKRHVLEGFVGEASDTLVSGETLSGSITIKEM